jgi:hypothetical protein
MKNKECKPSAKLMRAINEINGMIKSKSKGKSIHVAMAEMKLACIE